MSNINSELLDKFYESLVKTKREDKFTELARTAFVDSGIITENFLQDFKLVIDYKQKLVTMTKDIKNLVEQKDDLEKKLNFAKQKINPSLRKAPVYRDPCSRSPRPSSGC